MEDKHNPTDIEGQRQHQEEVADVAKLEAMQEAVDIKWLMRSVRGRRIVKRLLDKAGVNRLSFHSDPYMTAFNEGNRNLGNFILALVLEHSAGEYIKLLEGK